MTRFLAFLALCWCAFRADGDILSDAAAWTNGPYVSFIGDSITAGYPAYRPATDGGPSGINDANISYHISTRSAGAVVTTNRGVQGRKWSQMVFDATNALAQRPKFLFVRCGVNDLIATNDWTLNVLPYLDIVKATCGQSNTILVLQDIMPWTAGSDANALKLRTWNSNFTTWASTTATYRVPDHDFFGTNRAATGYIDNLYGPYNYDNIHINTNAYGFWAALCWTNLNNWANGYFGGSHGRAESVSVITTQ